MTWTEHAACAGADPELFYTHPNDHAGYRVAAALAYCQACPVTAECLTWALETRDPWAILGHTTPEQRAELMRR